MPDILVVDDDADIARLIADLLEEEGLTATIAGDGREALRLLETSEPDLVLLDIMMPHIDGLEVLRRIRGVYPGPIVLLSAKGRETDRVVGLEVGADDYIVKPFSTLELVARVKAHLRRQERQEASAAKPEEDAIVTVGDLRLDKSGYEAFAGGRRLELSAREFQILLLLAEQRHQVLSRDQIYEVIWGYAYAGDVQTVTVHLTNLRRKLTGSAVAIRTVWGVGYRLAERAP